MDKLKSRGCDIVTTDLAMGSVAGCYLQTDPYLSQQIVYITRVESPIQLDYSQIKNRMLGIPNGYPIIGSIRRRYGDVNIVEVKDVDEGLLMVSRGELYAFTDILSICSYSINKQAFTNLKVGGHLDLLAPAVMSVRSDKPILVGLLNKALATIDDTIINQFLNNWIKIEYDARINWRELAMYGVLVLCVLAVVLYWVRKLHILNRALDKENYELDLVNQTDALTMTKNRDFLRSKVPTLMRLAHRNHLSMGVAMLDIDHFKQVNDSYGHAVGDKCLVAFSGSLKTALLAPGGFAGKSNNTRLTSQSPILLAGWFEP
jgi:polar amino acid transport system substrate-binding protein